MTNVPVTNLRVTLTEDYMAHKDALECYTGCDVESHDNVSILQDELSQSISDAILLVLTNEQRLLKFSSGRDMSLRQLLLSINTEIKETLHLLSQPKSELHVASDSLYRIAEFMRLELHERLCEHLITNNQKRADIEKLLLPDLRTTLFSLKFQLLALVKAIHMKEELSYS